jgi:hypothetical protein
MKLPLKLSLDKVLSEDAVQVPTATGIFNGGEANKKRLAEALGKVANDGTGVLQYKNRDNKELQVTMLTSEALLKQL